MNLIKNNNVGIYIEMSNDNITEDNLTKGDTLEEIKIILKLIIL